MKRLWRDTSDLVIIQPPSGGCVLKPIGGIYCADFLHPAAFGRLCVETVFLILVWKKPFQPPSGGCVLKLILDTRYYLGFSQPPSGGCVLKPTPSDKIPLRITASRLRAAVC